MIFYGGRVSLLPINQNIFYKKGGEKDFSIITQLLSKRVEFMSHRGTIVIIEPIFDSAGTLIGGKLGRESKTKLPLREGGRLSKVTTRIYPHILFIVNPEEQLLLFQKDTQVFSDPLVVFKYLLKYLNRELFPKGLEADIKPLTTKGVFWQMVDDMQRVYSAHFKLKAPNFLGESYEDLSDLLRQESDETNANQIEYGISNDSGSLEVPKSKRFETAIGWIEDGGGEWKLKAKAGRGKRIKVYKSTHQLSVFEVDLEVDDINTEIVEKIISLLDIGPYEKKGDK